MAGALIGALRVTLGLDSADFTRGSKKAQAEATGLQRRMSAIGGVLKTAFAAAAGSALLNYVSDASKASLEYASTLGETAEQLGVTTSALQQYRFMATQVGIEQDVMDKGLVKISGRLGDLAAGAANAEKPFARLNLSTAELARLSGMTAEQALPFLADKFKALGSETERVAAAQELFGAKMGGKFMTLLNSGSGGINDMANAYRKLGIELSPEQIKRADDAVDTMSQLNQVLTAEQAKIATDNAEAVIAYEKAIGGLSIQLMKATTGVIGFFAEMVKGGDILAQNEKSLESSKNQYNNQPLLWDNLSSSYKEMTDSISANARKLGDAVMNAFAAAGTNANNAINWFGQLRERGVSYVASLVTSVSNWIGNKLSAVWNGAIAKIKEVVSWFDWMDNEVVRNSYVPDMVEGVNHWFGLMEKGMVGSTQRATESATEMMAAMRDAVGGILDRLFPEATAIRDVQGEIDQLTEAFKAGMVPVALYREAMDKLKKELAAVQQAAKETTLPPLPNSYGNDDGEPTDIGPVLDELEKKLPKIGGKVKTTFTDMARHVQNTAATIANAISDMQGALSGFVNSIKRGDIVGVIGGIANVIGSVLGAVKSIKSIGGPSGGSQIPAYAKGTSFHPGGLAMVGERGRELVQLPRGSKVFPNGTGPGMGGGMVKVMVEGSQYFDARVTQVSGGVVASATPSIMRGGAGLAQRRATTIAGRRLA